MIGKLKKRFIILAMVSLTVLLSVIVTGMNVINYNTVIKDADRTLEMLADNEGRLPFAGGGPGDVPYDDIDASTGERGGMGGNGFDGGMDRMPRGMTRDEAEESRFFTVVIGPDGNAVSSELERIYAVDSSKAESMAEDAVASGKSSGFDGDYRFVITEEGNLTRVTFLDCGRRLDAFRDFLLASAGMSLVGLLAVFGVICFFAGRIVRPVAESYEKQKRFITDAGHEIKTPLTIIKANIDVMKMDMEDASPDELAGELSGTLNESLDDIDTQVDRLTSLTNDLVYLSRMEEAGSTLTMTEVPVSDIVRDTAESFRPVADERAKVLDIVVEPSLSMSGSTKELEKLVSILVENALKYSPEGDRIRVSLRKEGRNAVLEVRNKTLIPIDDADLAHVFDRFYRTDKSRNSEAGGHGIGLSMASAIVAAHGGKIGARSGDGTEFIVTAAMPASA